MDTIREVLEAAGGVLRRRDLLAAGFTGYQLTRAVRSGHVRRARRGWYTTFAADDLASEAVRVGGRLTGAALLARYGAWIWDAYGLTVAVPPHAARLRPRRGFHVVWTDTIGPAALDDPGIVAGSLWAVPLGEALVQAARESSREQAVAFLDWALAAGLASIADLRRWFAAAPADLRGIVEWADPGSQSVIETIPRVRFVESGRHVQTQVPVGTRGHAIDLVVDDVAVEPDGRRFHEQSFEADRLKDLLVIADGRPVLRPSYDMIRRRWELVEAAVHEASLMQHRPERRAETGLQSGSGSPEGPRPSGGARPSRGARASGGAARRSQDIPRPRRRRGARRWRLEARAW
ncbi:type IV toxin-antitoxin system AbiEi family antitoxin domain-containing protein [Frigoribacterium sp. 2-23]|uniref:type IV toxin-antitoxin system AbiEi family antitoxin domain-containing protein n=1 Tax=Frigoribacterium sp. 2-23 TaxID=3415006 RepID=UPI003C6F52A2